MDAIAPGATSHQQPNTDSTNCVNPCLSWNIWILTTDAIPPKRNCVNAKHLVQHANIHIYFQNVMDARLSCPLFLTSKMCTVRAQWAIVVYNTYIRWNKLNAYLKLPCSNPEILNQRAGWQIILDSKFVVTPNVTQTLHKHADGNMCKYE